MGLQTAPWGNVLEERDKRGKWYLKAFVKCKSGKSNNITQPSPPQVSVGVGCQRAEEEDQADLSLRPSEPHCGKVALYSVYSRG